MMRESVTFQAILREGEARGELIGKRRTILRQLTRKFGTLPSEVTAKIEMLSSEQLKSLAEEILDMGSLDELERWV